jgi:lipopolysaccharide export system protein LptA
MRRPFLLVLLALLSACERPGPLEPTGSPARPQVALHGVTLQMFRGPEPTMQGRASQVTFHRQSSEVSAQQALIRLRPESASSSAAASPAPRAVEIRAPRLDGVLTTRQADLSGGVELHTQAGGLRGQTERAHFDGARMVASGDRPVQIRAPEVALDADGFAFDFQQEDYHFDGHVVAQVARPDAGTRPSPASAPAPLKSSVTITAHRLQVLNKTGQAVYTGDVKAVRGTTRIRCGRLVATYSSAQEVTRIECEGGVEVEDGNRWARGDRADFDTVKSTIEVTGSPEARQGPNWMTGTKVTFDLVKDTIDVTSPKAIFQMSTKPRP